MLRRVLPALGVFCLVTSHAPTAWSIQASHEGHDLIGNWKVGKRVLRPDFVSAPKSSQSFLGNKALKNFSVDSRNNEPRIFWGNFGSVNRNSNASKEDFLTHIENVFSTHSEFFPNLEFSQLVLDESALVFDKNDQFFKFRVERNARRVEDASVDFRFKRGTLMQIVNYSFSEAKEEENFGATITEKRVAALLDAKVLKSLPSMYRVVASKRSYRLVTVDVFQVERFGQRFRAQISRNDGSAFEIKPEIIHFSGRATADVYDRYYTENTINVPLSQLELKANNAPLLTSVQGEFSASANALPVMTGYKGSIVDVKVNTGTLVTKTAELSDEFLRLNVVRDPAQVNYEDKNVAQAMVFYHTNKMVNLARRFITSPWFDRTLTANANLSSVCNAHWDGTTINFYSAGSGCANSGLISDVVFHEWGHGLDHNTGGIEDGGYSEGFGDIMSLVMTGSNILGIGFFTDGRPVRDLGPDKIYPQDSGGGVHAEGLIIGSTFYDLLQALELEHGKVEARQILANYAFKMIKAASRYTDVYETLRVVDDDDANAENGSPNFCLINDTFSRHGLARLATACQLGEVSRHRFEEIQGNANGILEPGELVNLTPVLFNNTGVDLPALNATAAINPAVPGITLSQSNLRWDVIPAGNSQESLAPMTIQIANDVACGKSFQLHYALSAQNRSAAITMPMTLGKYEGRADTLAASGLPIPIPDLDEVDVPFDVNSLQWGVDTTVYTAHLTFTLSHTYMGDLKAQLIAPNGSRIEVWSGSGSAPTVTVALDLSDKLAGTLGRGQWKLRVIDDAEVDEGEITQATLTLAPNRFVCE